MQAFTGALLHLQLQLAADHGGHANAHLGLLERNLVVLGLGRLLSATTDSEKLPLMEMGLGRLGWGKLGLERPYCCRDNLHMHVAGS